MNPPYDRDGATDKIIVSISSKLKNSSSSPSPSSRRRRRGCLPVPLSCLPCSSSSTSDGRKGGPIVAAVPTPPSATRGGGGNNNHNHGGNHHGHHHGNGNGNGNSSVASANDPALVHRKVAVLGFRAVGKTSLTNAFVSGTFSETYDPTIENTHHKTIRFRKVHFATDIVDTAGMDEYSSISRNASVGVHGYALLFSIKSLSSFEAVIKINDALLDALGDAPDVPRVLVGSMRDLAGEGREVERQAAQSLADSWNIPYLECSSKTGENVAEVFHTLLREIEKDEGLLNEREDEGCVVL